MPLLMQNVNNLAYRQEQHCVCLQYQTKMLKYNIKHKNVKKYLQLTIVRYVCFKKKYTHMIEYDQITR